jgi:hypothetical protein
MLLSGLELGLFMTASQALGTFLPLAVASLHQQNYKNLFGLLAPSGTFSIVSKMERGNKYYKFDKLTIYGSLFSTKYLL